MCLAVVLLQFFGLAMTNIGGAVGSALCTRYAITEKYDSNVDVVIPVSVSVLVVKLAFVQRAWG
jgi:hypothetical protein